MKQATQVTKNLSNDGAVIGLKSDIPGVNCALPNIIYHSSHNFQLWKTFYSNKAVHWLI